MSNVGAVEPGPPRAETVGDAKRVRPSWPRPPVTDPVAADRRLNAVGTTWFLSQVVSLMLGGRPLMPLLSPLLAFFIGRLVPLLPSVVIRRLRLIQLLACAEAVLAIGTFRVDGRSAAPLQGLLVACGVGGMLVAASVGVTLAAGTPLRLRWIRVQRVLTACLVAVGAGVGVLAAYVGSSAWPWDSWPIAVQGAGFTLLGLFPLLTIVPFVLVWQKTRAWVVMWATWHSAES